MPRTPDFIIIGAMKAGTTTLHHDLLSHTDIFLPQDKEPETLIRYKTDRKALLKDYASLFRPAKPGQLLGEASTAYTKRPDFEGVAETALDVCGPDLKLIYLKRDPIKRIVSQYGHEYAHGTVNEPLNEAVLRHERYVAYSRYDWQLQPWREVFGDQNILVANFEDYVSNRTKTLNDIFEFLNVAPHTLPEAEESKSYNSASNRQAVKGIWRPIITSHCYQRVLKPLIPRHLRELWARHLLPRPAATKEQLLPEVESQLRRSLASTDVHAISFQDMPRPT